MDRTVLLIGETQSIVDVTGRIMSRNGFKVRKTVGASQGEEALAQKQPRLLIMDCELTDGSGIAVCQKLRSTYPTLRILMISNDVRDEVPAFQAGADDFIKKPYYMNVFLARIERLCR